MGRVYLDEQGNYEGHDGDDYDDEEYDADTDPYELDEDDDRSEFADPGGRSALRAATRDNPRDRPCPSCGAEDVLTRRDVQLGYQCDRCADKAERGYD